MNWGFEDVVAATLLIAGALLAIMAVRRLVHRRSLRLVFIAIVLLVVLAIWAHLAVGVF